MKEQEIHNICNEYDIDNYTINPDGSIDVDDNVNLNYRDLTKIPIKFNKVSGNFDCFRNQLTSLEGCPKEVGGYFSCSNNKLSTLDGYNGDLNKLYCNNKDKLVRKTKLKIIEKL